jgi:hypothetical protein
MPPYVNVSVPRPANNSGRGQSIKSILYLFDAEDIAVMPSRDEKGVFVPGTIVMNPGKYAIGLYMTSDTVNITSPTEGETDNEGFMQGLVFQHPGNSLAIREFKANWLGRPIIAIVEHCDDGSKDLFGNLCNPLKLAIVLNNTKDALNNEFTLSSRAKGDDIALYGGTIPREEPVATIAAGAVSIGLSGDGQYQLTGDSSTVSITGVSNVQDGMLFTFLGIVSGSMPPTISAGGSFLLRNGATWTATPGSQITFKAFRDGGDSFKYIEVSRI